MDTIKVVEMEASDKKGLVNQLWITTYKGHVLSFSYSAAPYTGFVTKDFEVGR